MTIGEQQDDALRGLDALWLQAQPEVTVERFSTSQSPTTKSRSPSLRPNPSPSRVKKVVGNASSASSRDAVGTGDFFLRDTADCERTEWKPPQVRFVSGSRRQSVGTALRSEELQHAVVTLRQVTMTQEPVV